LKKKFRRGRKRIITGFTKKKKRIATIKKWLLVNSYWLFGKNYLFEKASLPCSMKIANRKLEIRMT